MTVRMIAPANITGRVQGERGVCEIDGNGFVSVPKDLALKLLASGFRYANSEIPSAPIGADGMQTFTLPLLSLRGPDGAAIAASAGVGKFGVSATIGTSHMLVSEAAQNGTKTAVAMAEVVMPPSYKAGVDFNVTLNGKRTDGAGATAGACSIDLSAHKVSPAGAHGTDLVATDAQPLATTAGDFAFTVTGASLAPGDRVVLKVTVSVAESANGGTVTGALHSVRIG